MLNDRLESIQAEINLHKTQDEVTLIAVTKSVNAFLTNEIIRLGVTDIGENKAQTVSEKSPYIVGEVRLHFIGHLQRNKVKEIISLTHLIHSVDSVRLAREIDEQAGAIGKVQDILIQVNIAREESKFGFYEEDLEDALQEIRNFSNLKIRGFMMMAPLEADAEATRGYFRKMKELFDYYKNLDYNNMSIDYLSMGMTNDYKIALEEGSNMIRIGTALFPKEEA